MDDEKTKGKTIWLLLLISVADPDSDPVFFGHPDPDPGKYRIRILYTQKDPMLFKYSRYKIVLKTVSSK